MRFFCIFFALFVHLIMPARADLWGAADDRLLRADIELLADAGVIKGPLLSWPVNWAQVRGALASVDSAALAPHERSALLRLRRVVPATGKLARGFGVEFDAAFTNDPALVRTYGSQARGDYDAQVRLAFQRGKTHASLSVGLQDEPFGRNLTFDNAYVARELGNWIGYLGTVERWWGAGQNTALLFSTSARPQLSLGLKRNRPDPFESKWLSWIGPWSFDIFLSLQDQAAQLFENNIIAGIKIDIQPIKGFSFGVKRGLQVCGRGRPCGFSTWIDSLIPISNADNTGTVDEPGNQMAGFDMRYGTTIGQVASSVYGELLGDDETNFFPSKFGVLGGVKLAGPWGDGGARWEANAEYTNTVARNFFATETFLNTFYQNFIYRNGWRYRGRPIGSAIDNDSRLYSLTAQLTDTQNRLYRLALHHFDVNVDGSGRHSLSSSAESINIIEAETIWPTLFGDVRAELRLQDDDVNTPGSSPFRGAFELSYQLRF